MFGCRAVLGALVIALSASACASPQAPQAVETGTSEAVETQASESPDSRCVDDDGTAADPDLVVVSPDEAKSITVAEVLRRDGRFTLFRKLAEETATGITDSFMEAWDLPMDLAGNKVWLTLFVPPDTAFAVLDAKIRRAWDEGRLNQTTRYGWIGHHGFDRAYPSSDFREGRQPNDRGEPAEMTLDPLTYSGCPVLQTDLLASNGYIHVIGGVGVPAHVRTAAD